MLHNDGKSITHNWQCIKNFNKTFKVIPIEKTEFSDIDFKKSYTIQKKYSAAHFNTVDINPLFPHDETFVFQVVVKTPENPDKYPVKVVVYSGNHKNKFVHNLSILVNKSTKKRKKLL